MLQKNTSLFLCVDFILPLIKFYHNASVTVCQKSDDRFHPSRWSGGSDGACQASAGSTTGLSVSFLSLLERDKVSVSVDNLERLARYYRVHMVHFFGVPEENAVLVTRRADILQRLLENGTSPASVTLLTNRPNARVEHEMKLRFRTLLDGAGHPDWASDPELTAQAADFFERYLSDMRALVSRDGIVPAERIDALATRGWETPSDWAETMRGWQEATLAGLETGDLAPELIEAWFDSYLRSVANYNRYLIWGGVNAAALVKRAGPAALRRAVDVTSETFMWEVSKEFFATVLPAAGFEDIGDLMELGLRGMYADQYYHLIALLEYTLFSSRIERRAHFLHVRGLTAVLFPLLVILWYFTSAAYFVKFENVVIEILFANLATLLTSLSALLIEQLWRHARFPLPPLMVRITRWM